MKMSTLYEHPVPNFGDRLNSILFKKLFGAQFEICHEHFLADYIAIGTSLDNLLQRNGVQKFIRSIDCFLKRGNRPFVILGSAFNSHHTNAKFIRKCHIKLIRGELTAKCLRDNNLLNGVDVILGDPGLLANRLLDKLPPKKYKLGIIPHMGEMSNVFMHEICKKFGAYESLKSGGDCIFINVHDDPMVVVEQIESCERIASSALHGLIVSDSLGIPNLWLHNKYVHNPKNLFKYNDYYSSIGIIDMKPVQFIDFLNMDIMDIDRLYRVDVVTVQKKQNELFAFLKSYFSDPKCPVPIIKEEIKQ